MKRDRSFRVLQAIVILALLVNALAVADARPARAQGGYFPSIFASKDHGFILAQSWPADVELFFCIDDDMSVENGCAYDETTMDAVDSPWAPDQSWTIWDGVTIPAGAIITVSDGVYTKTLEISELKITDIDTSLDRITGITNHPERHIWVEFTETSGRYLSAYGPGRFVDEAGTPSWIADFSQLGEGPYNEILDLEPGMRGQVQEWDEDNDYTVYEFEIGWDVFGTISGQVRDYYGNLLTGESIIVAAESLDGSFTAEAWTDPVTGSYSLTAIPVGLPVIVAAWPQGYSRRCAQFWQGQNVSTDATLLTLDTEGQVIGNINFNLYTCGALEHYTFNLRTAALEDVRVRQAIAFGTDRQRILEEAFLPNGFTGILLNSPVPPGSPVAADPSELTLYPFDPAQSVSLLNAAGLFDTDQDGWREFQGQELVLKFITTNAPMRMAAAQVFQENMAAIGLQVNLVFYPPIGNPDQGIVGLFDPLEQGGPLYLGDFDIAEWAIGRYFEDENTALIESYASAAVDNFGGYSNVLVDQALADYYAATTTAERLGSALTYQQLITADLPAFYLFARFVVPMTWTFVGPNVTVNGNGGEAVTFGEVIAEGRTLILSSESVSYELPENFQALGNSVYLSTTAVFTSAQVCLPYSDEGLTLAQEQSIRLLHYEDHNWVDVTDPGYPDTEANRVCGTVTSFSPFQVVLPKNQPPVLDALNLPIEPVQVGSPVQASATFHDPDPVDTHMAVWNWGDGTTSNGAVDEGAGRITGDHTYNTPGVYTVQATVRDAAGEESSLTFEYVVVYDPNGGFVTGGGWITSPAGAYEPDPAMTGKATFGFVSRYQKGATVPSGNTEFQFKTANFTFSSVSYEWLVVAGARAQYKGIGTINGAGSYGFLLTAIDGTPDRFRIKIWDRATGVVVYDNQRGGTDTADPTTAIMGGSITVHRTR